jgi:ABC-2 type transport system permease protein
MIQEKAPLSSTTFLPQKFRLTSLAPLYIIWYRDILRFYREKSQIYTSLFRPLLWLFAFGAGLRPSFQGVAGFNYLQFIFPGVIAMTLIFTAIGSAISIIWDREFGFLKEILVAPIPRSWVVLGKCLSGSTLAMLQGICVMVFAPLVGVHLTFLPILASILVMFLVSMSLTALGIILAARMTSFEGFGAIMNFVIMPLYFLSGAVYPLKGIPRWLYFCSMINPLTYGVDLLRSAMISIHGFPILLDVAFLLAFCATMLAGALFALRYEDK